ncbi:hypothetical protein BV20DRAFT_1065820 [Pilatotrama ljubarskyi]|nr:hypothetical protein BV20DRAFT_1065820 [Pilatotrama ljubarskyi]
MSLKRKRDGKDEPEEAPPRQVTKVTQEQDVHPSTGSSAETLVDPLPATTPTPPVDFTPPAGWQAPEPVVVANAGHYQHFIDRLAWGAQWEFARYINTGFDVTFLDIPKLVGLSELSTNATAAPEVKKLVERTKKAVPQSAGQADPASDEYTAAYARELSAKLPWNELDKEEEILRDHPLGGLGCNHDKPFLANDPDWYGGKVHFTAQLHKERRGEYRLNLDRPALGSSNRFTRRFGSRRFIRVRVPKGLLWEAKGDELPEYFKRPFIVGNAVFRAFYAKEQNVFLFRTNEAVLRHGGNYGVVPSAPGSKMAREEYSLLDLIKWHNDLELNADQAMAKWAARFALGLSNSIPGIRLEAHHIRFQDDIICEAFAGPGKPPSEMQMTDGCGFANRAVMRALKGKFPSWQDEPTAIQCRIGGAKGLLLVRHDLTADEEIHPTVWLRPSQLKIKYTSLPLNECLLPPDSDPALLTIDVLRASRMHSPARLSIETITNLAENGVPHECFKELFKVNLQERLDALLQYKEPADMPLLWNAIAREGGVITARIVREAAGVARAAGYVADDYDDDVEADDEDGLDGLDKALREQSSAWWEDPISGLPSSLEETCLTLLESGFIPKTCPVLRAKLREVAKRVVTTFETRCKFSVPMSCSAFIVPDPYGVLGPNEIHVKCSRRAFIDQEGRATDLVIGDALVTRHPCKVPSDVQKVKAVFNDRLRHYCDVIVISTKSHMWQGQSLNRHLASLTGGGDYDGDTMEVFWDPLIVNSFEEPDPHLFASEPPEVQQCLLKSTRPVSAFLREVPPTAPAEYRIFALQEYLLGALKRSHASTYSIWWEKCTYALGYSHRETVFLAYMFCALLDGIKTGVTINPEAFERHQKQWGPGALRWKVEMKERGETPGNANPFREVKRQSLPRFIMDILSEHVKVICKKQLNRIYAETRADKDRGSCRDEDLARPWLDAERRAAELRDVGEKGMSEELERIKQHVESLWKEKRTQGGRGTSGKASFTELPIERRQDILRQQSRDFHASPTGLRYFDDPTTIKASYAYIYDYEHAAGKWSRFPWDVAARALCEIKAKAKGGPKTLAEDFHRWMTISPVYLRHRAQNA